MRISSSGNLQKRFDEELRFFKSWVDRPRAMGAVLPTSMVTARRMASLIPMGTSSPVLELGPGTGAITKAILERVARPEQLFSVEYTADFLPQLRTDFPGVNFLHGDAFDLDDVLEPYEPEPFEAVISGIPMLNFPTAQRLKLLEDLFDRLKPGRPIVQISYGPTSPIPPNWSTHSVEPLEWIIRNLPPARLWVYRRINGS